MVAVSSIACAATSVIVVYVTVLLGLRLTSSIMLIGFVAASAAMAVAWYFAGKRYAILGQAVARERLVVIAGTVLCVAAYPLFADSAYQVHVIAMGGIFAIMALGLNINIGYAGLADFGYIAYYAIGAYASAILSSRFGLSFWLCLPLAALAAGVLSLLVPFPPYELKGHYLALVTLGFAFIVMQLITNLDGLTGGTQGDLDIKAPYLFSHSFRMPLDLGFVGCRIRRISITSSSHSSLSARWFAPGLSSRDGVVRGQRCAATRSRRRRRV